MLRFILLWLISPFFASSVTATAATVTVDIQNFVFNPKKWPRKFGQSVKW